MVDRRTWITKSRLGGLRRIQLYGNPGTAEGRSKGGNKAIRFFRDNPAAARKSGFTIRKDIKYPKRGVELAEFIGIMLGDGGLPGNHQITVSFNDKTDSSYAQYIGRIIKRLFHVGFHIHKRKGSNGADIVLNSSNLVDFLISQGLKTGSKVENQVDIPAWIRSNLDYQKACLRGLIDTDGSFYYHTYNSKGKGYKYLKLCFSNRSRPLLFSVSRIFRKLDFSAYLHGDNVFINSMPVIKRYFREIGSHNPKHLDRIAKFLAN